MQTAAMSSNVLQTRPISRGNSFKPVRAGAHACRAQPVRAQVSCAALCRRVHCLSALQCYPSANGIEVLLCRAGRAKSTGSRKGCKCSPGCSSCSTIRFLRQVTLCAPLFRPQVRCIRESKGSIAHVRQNAIRGNVRYHGIQRRSQPALQVLHSPLTLLS